MTDNFELATLGGGCFWCLEAVYEQLQGVKTVESGFSGGFVKNPSYEAVCSGTTGHAEVVQLSFDPQEASYKDILLVFFTIHDPTTLNRQGADVGRHYRSAIFYHNAEQNEVAREVIAEIEATGIWERPIVTEVTPYDQFYRAEAYHQEYYKRNSNQGYCRVVIEPKVVKFRQKFSDRLK